MNKYIVWIKEDGRWIENGEGPLTLKQAERIAKETRKDCGVAAKVLPVGIDP
jgi:hypothetical protein